MIAVAGSFAALEMIERWRNARGGPARAWQLASAVAFGSSVWSMHFIGILALRMAFPLTHAPGATALSLLIAIAVVGLGLEIVRDRVTRLRVGCAGVAVGLGIAAMHYLGMSGLRFGGSLAYTPTLWGLSFLVAIGAATAALWLSLTLQRRWHRGVAALLMGFAICGMHYTAMEATVFQPDPLAGIEPGLPSGLLAIGVALLTLALILCALVLVAADRRLFASGLREASMLQSSIGAKLEAINAELELSRRQLDQKSRLLETTLESIAQGIVMLGPDECVLVTNSRMEQLFDAPSGSTSGVATPDPTSCGCCGSVANSARKIPISPASSPATGCYVSMAATVSCMNTTVPTARSSRSTASPCRTAAAWRPSPTSRSASSPRTG